MVLTMIVGITMAACNHRPTPVEYNGHMYIDLGLPSGTKWATCNLGATNPEDRGDYYSWGETQPHNENILNEGLWHENELGILRRHGAIDGNNNLTAGYDAATANWGGKWRMPTKAEFEELKEFVSQARFDRMGAFAYSEEDGTYAAQHFPDEVPPQVKERRLAEIMEMQEEIALELNEAKVGQTMKVIIDREEPDYFVGRTEFDSPEVDPEVLVEKAGGIAVGQFANVTITEAMPFELIGKINR